MIHGWLSVYKPKGITSAKVVALVRKHLKIKKIGHGGTLDPLAEGVLPLAIGEATKTVSYIIDHSKFYEFEVTWGAQTSTDDLEGEVIATSDKRPSQAEILAALDHFKGSIEQTPPQYSAIKINGKRAYDMARKNISVDLKPRHVIIDDIQLIEIKNINCAVFQVYCGKGTYVRSLARDIGLKLGTYGHISRLERMKVGKFSKSRSISLEKIQELGHKGLAEEYMYSITDVLDDIPAICVSEEQQKRLLRGQSIELTSSLPQELLSEKVLCTCTKGNVLAIATYTQGLVKPTRVFNIFQTKE